MVRHGHCLLGVSNRSSRHEASIAVDGDLGVAVNGVIDNAADLARALGLRNGPEFSHAALLLAAFRRLGWRAPRDLRGVFAAVVTDGQRAWAFRDQLGFRSLFYRNEPDRVFFASEAKQVVAGAGIARRPDPDVVAAIVFSDYDDDTPCAVSGVRRLAKSTVMMAGAGRSEFRRYWDPESLIETATFSEEELQERFDELMDQANARMLTGHDAVSLSGGIDSPAIAAYAAPRHLELGGRPLSALSAVYPDQPSVDEREYIEIVAADLDIPLHTFEHQAGQLDRLTEWVEVLDGPTPVWAVNEVDESYRRAEALGFRTLLTGEVAEHVMAMRSHLETHLIYHGRFRALQAQLRLQQGAGAGPARTARNLIRWAAPGRLRYMRSRRQDRYRGAPRPDFLDAERLEGGDSDLLVGARTRWHDRQLVAFGGPGIGVEADEVRQELRNIMVRMPWTDVDLWEFFISLRAEQKFPGRRSKDLVRHLLRGRVPDAILDREKPTVFNEAIMAGVDYPALRHWILGHDRNVDGVDYGALAGHLEREDLTLWEYIWARDLAVAHAFLSLG